MGLPLLLGWADLSRTPPPPRTSWCVGGGGPAGAVAGGPKYPPPLRKRWPDRPSPWRCAHAVGAAYINEVGLFAFRTPPAMRRDSGCYCSAPSSAAHRCPSNRSTEEEPLNREASWQREVTWARDSAFVAEDLRNEAVAQQSLILVYFFCLNALFQLSWLGTQLLQSGARGEAELPQRLALSLLMHSHGLVVFFVFGVFYDESRCWFTEISEAGVNRVWAYWLRTPEEQLVPHPTLPLDDRLLEIFDAMVDPSAGVLLCAVFVVWRGWVVCGGGAEWCVGWGVGGKVWCDMVWHGVEGGGVA